MAKRGRAPIVTRRGLAVAGGAGVVGGGDDRWKAGTARLSCPPPLFEMHFEMNPRDPEYDAKIYLAVDQVGVICERWLYNSVQSVCF